MLLRFSLIFCLLFVGTLSCFSQSKESSWPGKPDERDYGIIAGRRVNWVSEIKSCNQGKLSQTNNYNLKKSLQELELTYERINEYSIDAVMDTAVFDSGAGEKWDRWNNYYFEYDSEQGSEKVYVVERRESTIKDNNKEQHSYMRLKLYIPRTGSIRLENYVEAESRSDHCAHTLVNVAMISILKK